MSLKIRNYLRHVGGVREFTSDVDSIRSRGSRKNVARTCHVVVEVDYARQHKVGICNVTLSH